MVNEVGLSMWLERVYYGQDVAEASPAVEQAMAGSFAADAILGLVAVSEAYTIECGSQRTSLRLGRWPSRKKEVISGFWSPSQSNEMTSPSNFS